MGADAHAGCAFEHLWMFFMVRGQVFDEELWVLEKRGEAAQNLKLSMIS